MLCRKYNFSFLLMLVLSLFGISNLTAGITVTYYGALDNVYSFTMTLERNQTIVEGHYSFDGSEEIYQLSGHIKDEIYYLSEFDSSGLNTAVLELSVNNKNLNGSWQSVNNLAYYSIFAYPDRKSFNRTFEKHLRQFSGKFNNKNMLLTLAHMANKQVNGKIYYTDSKKTVRVRGNCENLACSEISLLIKDDLGTPISEANLKRAQNGQWYLTSDGKSLPVRRSYQRKLNSKGQSRYNIFYDIVYPNWPNPAYQKWITSEIVLFEKNCEASFEEKYNVEIGQHPNYRASIQAYAWVEIDFLSDYLISGIVHFQYPDQVVHSKTFSFWDQNVEAIQLEHEFKRTFNLDKFVQARKNEFISSIADQNENLDEWLNSTSFSNQTFRREGICYSTDFHPRYGKISFVIPYSNLQQRLKKKSIIHQIYTHDGIK